MVAIAVDHGGDVFVGLIIEEAAVAELALLRFHSSNASSMTTKPISSARFMRTRGRAGCGGAEGVDGHVFLDLEFALYGRGG